MPRQSTLSTARTTPRVSRRPGQRTTAPEIALYANGRRAAQLDGTEEWQDLVLASNTAVLDEAPDDQRRLHHVRELGLYTGPHFYTHESLVSMGGSLGTNDQRMCFHPFYTMLFPGLDQSEVTTFGDVQPADGAISHMNGNVGYGWHSASAGVRHHPLAGPLVLVRDAGLRATGGRATGRSSTTTGRTSARR